jgi:hypothetical protein
MRFVAIGARSADLTVQSLYHDAAGRERMLPVGSVHGGDGWALTPILPLRASARAADFGDALDVTLRFIPRGPGAWRIDDVYVDPYRSR